MDSIGAEVGQKMRSAIKAKLMELECYVDEELPDYIMVMVANRRTKSQMNEDLNLFLASKTPTFVNWLHIVLKKLKEVTVTNPDVYKKALKRKSVESMPDDKSSLKVKKEKSLKKLKSEVSSSREEEQPSSSITDDLPVTLNKLPTRRVILSDGSLNSNIVDDSFDIPLLSEVSESMNEQELQDIEKKIRNVRTRLGLLVESDSEDNPNGVKDKNGVNSSGASTQQLRILNNEIAEANSTTNQNQLVLEEKKRQHKRISFESEEETLDIRSRLNKLTQSGSKERYRGRSPPTQRRSILERLGKRLSSPEKPRTTEGFRQRLPRSHSADRSGRNQLGSVGKERNRSRSPLKTKREGILSRLGVQSKVAVVKRPEAASKASEEEDETVVREVQSLIKVNPRVLPSNVAQPNKNLLLKAMADAQRSIAQTTNVGKEVKPELFTKRYLEKPTLQTDNGVRKPATQRVLLPKEASGRLKGRLELSSDEFDSDGEYIPKSVKNAERDVPSYIPSSKSSSETEFMGNEPKEDSTVKQQFIITLDGIEKFDFLAKKTPVKSRLDTQAPSPIVFGKTAKIGLMNRSIPDELPVVRTSFLVKNKERCRYWPACRQGDKCEFVHPCEPCQTFPHCKFRDSCLFLHPKCKFSAGCTKRECPYEHGSFKASQNAKFSNTSLSLQSCRFFPNCINTHLPGYVAKAAELKQQGISDIICMSVNDLFVMAAWAKDQGTAGKIRLLADPSAALAKALDLTVDIAPLGGIRSKRYSMVVEDGKITSLQVEPDGTGLSCSLADKIKL
ncbi:hypothetical protein HUJ04_009580 [Dendroctonus ponderosae]|nr:hypothetical protein HUJ04_009580 [Dendroctonus ponderosae]